MQAHYIDDRGVGALIVRAYSEFNGMLLTGLSKKPHSYQRPSITKFWTPQRLAQNSCFLMYIATSLKISFYPTSNLVKLWSE